MFIKCISVGPLEANCYILCDTVESKSAVIDPGADAARILAAAEELKSRVEYVILTHGHADHMGAARQVMEKSGAKLACASAELPLLSDPQMNLSALFGDRVVLDKPSFAVEDGATLPLGRLELAFLLTPGHTPGSCCVICQDTIFTGDTLFCGDAGRTDLPGGDAGLLRASLRKLSALPGDYRLLPGHGGFSTLDQERKTNPFMAEGYHF